MPPTATDDTEVEQELDTNQSAELEQGSSGDDAGDAAGAQDATQQTETEVATDPFAEAAKKHGLEYDGDPEKLFASIADQKRRYQQYEQVMPFYQRDAAELKRIREEQARQQQAAQQAQAEQARKKWEAPKRDPRWSQIIALDPETNQPVIQEKFRGLVNPSVLDEYTKYQEFRKNAYDKLVESPLDFYEETGLYDTIQERINNAVQERLTQHDHQSALNDFREQHGQWAFATDATGQESLTELGQVFNTFLGQAQALNPNASTRQHIKQTWGQFSKWVEVNRPDLLADEQQAQTKEPPKTAAQLRDEKNGQFLKKAAAKTPNRGPAKAEDDTRRVENFAKRTKQLAEEKGVPEDDWGKVPE